MPGPTTVGERFDIICVGDVATDVFVTVSPECAEIRSEPDGPKLVLPFGAKLPCAESITVPAGETRPTPQWPAPGSASGPLSPPTSVTIRSGGTRWPHSSERRSIRPS